MSTIPLTQVLETGTCPICREIIANNEMMTNYFCARNPKHFSLKIIFHEGEELTAIVNGYKIPKDELATIDW